MKPPKNVGVVGPTNVSLMEQKVGLADGTLKKAARDVGAFLAEQSLGMVCIPVQGVPLWALEAYKLAGGMNSLALWPGRSGEVEDPKELKQGNPGLADRIKEDVTWGAGPAELAKCCDGLVSIGLSCGTMLEIIATKWKTSCPVFVVDGLMTGIPDEIAAELDIRHNHCVESLKQNILNQFG